MSNRSICTSHGCRAFSTDFGLRPSLAVYHYTFIHIFIYLYFPLVPLAIALY